MLGPLAAPRPYDRVTDALLDIANHYAMTDAGDTLRRAGSNWQAEALAQLAEAVAALLLEVRPQADRTLGQVAGRGPKG